MRRFAYIFKWEERGLGSSRCSEDPKLAHGCPQQFQFDDEILIAPTESG
jgi:hypothetical protein